MIQTHQSRHLSTNLNDYQQLMLRLSTLAPYNAVHSVLMNDDINVPALEESINATLDKLSLGLPEFSSDLRQVGFKPLENQLKIETRFLTLEAHGEQEMGYSFSMNELPFRFFIIQDKNQCYLSLTYNHWIADAYSINNFIAVVFARFRNGEPRQLTLDSPPIHTCFKHVFQNFTSLHRYLALMKSFFMFSRAFRININKSENTVSGCQIYFFEKHLLTHLLHVCKMHHMTLNDLFITVLALIFGRFTAEKRQQVTRKFLKPKRDRITIAVISNIRGHSQIPLSQVFSLFLSFFYLSFKSPEKHTFQSLGTLVHTATSRLKQKKAIVKNYLLFKVQKMMWDKTRGCKFRLFSKNTPITVGISNINLNENVLDKAEQYVRFSPAAMICPIVFSLTTYNGDLTLGINYRKACFTVAEAESLKNAFVAEINKL